MKFSVIKVFKLAYSTTEQPNVWLFKWQQPYFDNQTFGYRGTTVIMLLHELIYQLLT